MSRNQALKCLFQGSLKVVKIQSPKIIFKVYCKSFLGPTIKKTVIRRFDPKESVSWSNNSLSNSRSEKNQKKLWKSAFYRDNYNLGLKSS